MQLSGRDSDSRKRRDPVALRPTRSRVSREFKKEVVVPRIIQDGRLYHGGHRGIPGTSRVSGGRRSSGGRSCPSTGARGGGGLRLRKTQRLRFDFHIRLLTQDESQSIWRMVLDTRCPGAISFEHPLETEPDPLLADRCFVEHVQGVRDRRCVLRGFRIPL